MIITWVYFVPSNWNFKFDFTIWWTIANKLLVNLAWKKENRVLHAEGLLNFSGSVVMRKQLFIIITQISEQYYYIDNIWYLSCRIELTGSNTYLVSERCMKQRPWVGIASFLCVHLNNLYSFVDLIRFYNLWFTISPSLSYWGFHPRPLSMWTTVFLPFKCKLVYCCTLWLFMNCAW